jgi:hypothetical protein
MQMTKAVSNFFTQIWLSTYFRAILSLDEYGKLIFLFSAECDYKYSCKHDIIARINYLPVK